MYLISVYFDEKTNKIIQRYVNLIAERTGNTFMTEHKVPPHLTISAIEAKSVEVLIPQFEQLRGTLTKGELRFVSVGQILPYVMYATPVLNEYLQDLAKQVYEEMSDIPETTISKYYRPLSWLPHVTLGKTLDTEQMQKAFAVLQQYFVPFTARVEEIGLAKVNPHDDVVRFEPIQAVPHL